ncbi:heterokaryon incompatibility protein-domain-containing protein [Nemania sp. FL0916]|nr:heterokaryon incompatibility protein-domain-containing protein [Nemania sp. FL0916]
MDEFVMLPGQYAHGDFCNLCREIEATIRSHSSSSHSQQTVGARDVYLGRKSELLARSAHCHSCRAIVTCAEDDKTHLSQGPASIFAGDYDLSAHVMDKNPILCIAFGSLPSQSRQPSKRRELITQLGVVWLFSTEQNIPEDSATWLPGVPRLFDPEQCDPFMISDWLQCCNSLHGDRCVTPAAWLLRSEISRSFIDIELECIVTPSKEVPFVALSYVWGTVETLQALKSNINKLKQPGSLAPESGQIVPRTIRDAMAVCALTGQRYLWVDRVCIVQDDYETKQLHLHAMAETYAKAEFTIVAADGSDANHGLSGFGQSIEERQNHLVPFPNKPLIRGTMWALGDSFSSSTIWSSRAWTFQEHVFSRRLLYINKFVSWVCGSARWTETISASPNTSQSESTGKKLPLSDGKLFVIGWPSLAYYASMVQQYNMRQLTYDWDISNAFTGLMTQMCEGFPAGFFGGIPEFYFTICLLWQPKRSLRPRLAQNGANSLPTWSWLAWSGELDLQMWTCNTDTEFPPAVYEVTISPLVEWFKAPDRQSTSRIDDSYVIVRKHFLEKAAPPPEGWQKHDGDPGSAYHSYYTYHSRGHISSERKFRYPVPPFQRPRDINAVESSSRYLYAKVQKALFVFGTPENVAEESSDGEDGKYDAIELPLYTPSSMWAGFMRINTEDQEALPIGQTCEVIRISRGSLPLQDNNNPADARSQTHLRNVASKSREFQQRYPFKQCADRRELQQEQSFDFCFVLWIHWDGDTACRRALGMIWEPIWEQAGAEEVDIKLG